MKTLEICTVGLVAGALVISSGAMSFAQHSSGGTPPSVTEDKGGQSGSKSGNKSGDQTVVPSRESSGKMSPQDRMIEGSKPFGEGSGKSGSSKGSSSGSTSSGSSSGGSGMGSGSGSGGGH
jgi:hypothetical protein